MSEPEYPETTLLSNSVGIGKGPGGLSTLRNYTTLKPEPTALR